MLNLYRRVALRHDAKTTDLSVEWLPRPTGQSAGNGFPRQRHRYKRANGWASIPASAKNRSLPQGGVLPTSGPA